MILLRLATARQVVESPAMCIPACFIYVGWMSFVSLGACARFSMNETNKSPSNN